MRSVVTGAFVYLQLFGATHLAAASEDDCGFLVDKQGERVQCDTQLRTDCKNKDSLVRSCPASCPFVDRSQFFPCFAKCVPEDGCSPGLRGIEFANPKTKTCDVCEAIGCVDCDPESPSKCLKCNEPVFKLKNGICHYTLEQGFGIYLTYFIAFAVCICLPATIFKLIRGCCFKSGRPRVLEASTNHMHMCKPNVMTTVERPDGTAQVTLSMPTFFKTNVHRDFICGVGIALYYNWIVFLGLWGLVCYAVLTVYQSKMDFANLALDSKQCPAMRERGNFFVAQKYEMFDVKKQTPAEFGEAGHKLRELRLLEETGKSIVEFLDDRDSSFVGANGELKAVSEEDTADAAAKRKLLKDEALEQLANSNDLEIQTLLKTNPSALFDFFQGNEKKPNLHASLELQRFQFAESTLTASYLLLGFTFVVVLAFAKFQKHEEGMFDADNATGQDYCFVVEGLPTDVVSPDALNAFFDKYCNDGTYGHKRVLGVSIAYDYDATKKLNDASYFTTNKTKCVDMTFPEITELLLARHDTANLARLYNAEKHSLAGKGEVDSVGSEAYAMDYGSELSLKDYSFYSNFWYVWDYFLCFLSPHGGKLWAARQKAIDSNTEMELLAPGDSPSSAGVYPLMGGLGQSPLSARHASPEAVEILRKCEKVGLVAPGLTAEEEHEITDELKKIKSSGIVYVFCNLESDVDMCVDMLKKEQEKRLDPANFGGFSGLFGVGNDPATLDDNGKLEKAFNGLTIHRCAVDPIDILWENFHTHKSFVDNWIRGPMGFVIQIILYGLLMYAPAIIFMVKSLKESSHVPASWSMTILGIIFSSGNGVVGLMFWKIATNLPFRYRRSQWATVMLLYTILFCLNTAFSIYLVFGKVYAGGSAHHDKDVKRDHLGEETFLGKNLFELLVPGTFLMPFFTYPLIGYTLRRLLRLFNNFIPFTDDLLSARTVELRHAETYTEPPGIYIAWDYAAHLTLPLCCGCMFYLACPQFIYRLYWSIFVWAVWMYCSQKYLHLGQSKATYYSSGVLSAWCFNLFSAIVALQAGGIAWWEYRVGKFAAEVAAKVSKDGSLPNTAALDAEILWKLPVYALAAATLYLLILNFVIKPFEVEHKLQMEGDGIPFTEVETRSGFNFENTNTILVLRSYFLADYDSGSLLTRNKDRPIVPYAPGKQYLLNHFDQSFDLLGERLKHMPTIWDTGANAAARGSEFVKKMPSFRG